jgi:hypothetical protein
MLYCTSGRCPDNLNKRNFDKADYLIDFVHDKRPMNQAILLKLVLEDSVKAKTILVTSPKGNIHSEVKYWWNCLVKWDIFIEDSEDIGPVTCLVEEPDILVNTD